MLTVSFASGASTRVAYNPGMTVDALLALPELRGHPEATKPAPGRERAYLAAAVHSHALVPPAAVSVSADPTVAATSPAAAADVMVGSAFVADGAFPPRQLRGDAMLEDEGVAADGKVFVTLLAPQVLVDQTTVAGGVLTRGAKQYVRCADLHKLRTAREFQFGGMRLKGLDGFNAMVVVCDGQCGADKGVVVGGTPLYHGGGHLCASAIHSGAIGTSGGPYVVRTMREPGMKCYGCTQANGITSQSAADDAVPALTIRRYSPGAERNADPPNNVVFDATADVSAAVPSAIGE